RSHWTCNNTGNNGTFIEAFIKSTFPEMQNPHSLLIACFLHVINLCAQDMIKALNKTPKINPNNQGNDFDNVNDETFDKQTIKGLLLWKV
ncbi:hypothetical protein DXG01_010716, partial [Tephrocybe rancida]